ncbi:MOG interacting and ectopic P-granules protein 1 isoform X1 [Acyrthosiphon pisum]|uniref:MOG interacting and ectopic P-granules protein 1 n=1 Tax=Acyrthosiphon pisum TaxID=7029 RepID=A0A8R2AEM6_ACYPI|nr:MOG interacting and ectopic P-granules protein 1 isoform X1 [Acyrthosiphon pisum]XP_008185192.1 MOG interacting and ectopic P-granules protein 1 isoform X1 [Acyrthosiphon pisum]XP_016661670.1 MOG interacting and ectopic P-granules protein 1 isoform X1 [Acyrthosiphon pisum]XP_029344088.1 MOG interacting and ectopic P-granules protein 1 isoform X1 [Acyrthosiphon pisum]XP_029344091.1 MOG interacting and ectopic P-granules protein 1 isoform X1 [Acyrthosiphon pisum]|eukprot:XP_003246006.1 PREDICTED: MOG interacting and ectopic P-granules protein 1 isoform X1 [Acyrthosiphon pisum]
MADTEIEQITETDLSVKLNGNIRENTEQLKQSIDSQKTNKMIDKNEQNHGSSLNSDKSLIESRKSLSNCSNNGEDDYCEINDEDNDSEDEHQINNTDCKSDNSIIEDDQTLDSENATINSDDLCDPENSYNGTKEINSNDNEEQMEVDDTVDEQKTEDDEQMDDEDEDDDEEDEIIDQNDTESRSNEIKKSLEDSRINLDKSVTIVKVPDPKQNSGSSGKKKMKSLPDITLTPRRSTRNLNKLKSFSDKDEEKKDSVIVDDNTKILPQKSPMITKPIVVNDTKKLVEIAAGTKQKSNKKEPTLVIIDTNMLTGRSNLPIAVSVQSNTPNNAMNVTQTVSKSIQNSYNRVQHSQTTIKPFILTTTPTPVTVPTNVPKPPIILPTLTDDMFVVEAPSFIVPYVYEKPPKKPLKEFVEKIVKIKVAKEDEDENQCDESLDKKNENNQKEKSNKKSETNENMDVDESENEVSGCEKKTDGCKENSPKNNENGDEKMLDESESTKKDDSISKNLSESTDLKKSNSITDLTVDSDEKKTDVVKPKIQSPNYFENPLGKFFMQIGVNLVQEHVQLDLLRTQRRKRDREGDKCPQEVHMAISSLIKTLEFSKENNDPFQFGLKKCELCNFKSESSLVMAHHLETPHMTANYCYRCNFCTFQVRSPHEILQHMDTHNIRGRLERGPALHQCPSCPFEDSYKGKLTRHLISCSKKYRPEINQAPPLDWEPPAKIPRVLRNKPSMSPGNAVYQAAMSGFKQFPNPNMLQLQQQQYNKMVLASGVRARGRTVLPGQRFPGMVPSFPTTLPNQTSGGILLKNTSIKPINQPIIVPTSYSMSNHTYQQNSNSSKSVQQPSISITPLPRSFPSNSTQSAFVSTISKSKPQQTQSSSTSTNSSNKPTFVICEICDGYIKDLEQLRNHMQWIHKVKIHPKMIYNRPPLNCQKCQFRFFTDQGLERHLLGSHGLVTSSMQEAANKGKDGGRCPVCGRVYQWKLLNHVSRDHSISLKPAHLSYKCTVCTATFGMYKQFENHVYSAHSNVAKNSNKKPLGNQPIASSSSSSTSITSSPKPLKINDEITIIPQPPKIQNLSVKSSNSNKQVTSAGKQSSTLTAKAKV